MLNPIRRNRNIGTAKQGRGQNNKYSIPESWRDNRVFHERLNAPVLEKRKIRSKEFIFLVEPTLEDYTHCCSIHDVEKMIELLPEKDVNLIDIFVFRQPTRIQKVLRPVWGRLVFSYKTKRCEGTAVILEAQSPEQTTKWTKYLNPEYKRELSRLERDGHQVITGKREVTINSNRESCRITQLFRTIPHEIGHMIDYLESGEEDFDSKPARQKEDFAHRYADEFLKKMEDEGKIPF